MKSLRILIESGSWPAGEKEAQRVALQATLRISDPLRQHDLRERLVFEISMIELDSAVGGDGTDARRTVIATLDEIEDECRRLRITERQRAAWLMRHRS